MTQFGKRVAVGAAAYPSRPSGRTDVDDALAAVVRTGELPAWTTVGPIKLVLGLLLMAAALCFLTVTYAGDLLRDIRFAGTWQAAYDLRVVSGSCTRHNFVVTRCSAKILSNAEPNQAPLEREFMMLFSSGGGERLVPVRSTANPAVVAIAYAAETKLANRTITFLVLAGACAAILIGIFGALATGRYKGGAAHDDLIDGIAALQARAESTQPFSRTAT
jgi:hypothetical protein